MSQVHNVTHVPVHSLPLAVLAVVPVLDGGALRGGGTAPQRRVTEDRMGWSQGGTFRPQKNANSAFSDRSKRLVPEWLRFNLHNLMSSMPGYESKRNSGSGQSLF